MAVSPGWVSSRHWAAGGGRRAMGALLQYHGGLASLRQDIEDGGRAPPMVATDVVILYAVFSECPVTKRKRTGRQSDPR